MKKLLFTLFLTIGLMSAYAQDVRFNAYSGYAFDDKVDSYYDPSNYYNGKVQGGFLWGGGFEVKPNKMAGIEVMYLRMDTQAPMDYFNAGKKFKVFDVGINQVMVGFNRYFPTGNSRFEAYGGAMMGLSIFSIKNSDAGGSKSATKFGYGLRLGTNIFLSDRVGIKLQTQLFSAAQSVGGGLYFGTGGAGVGLTSYSSFLQFGLGGGLVFKLGGQGPKK